MACPGSISWDPCIIFFLNSFISFIILLFHPGFLRLNSALIAHIVIVCNKYNKNVCNKEYLYGDMFAVPCLLCLKDRVKQAALIQRSLPVNLSAMINLKSNIDRGRSKYLTLKLK